VYTYFTYAAAANTITDDVTKLAMHRVFNTNCGISFSHISQKNLDYLMSFNKNEYCVLEFMLFSKHNDFTR